MEITINIDERDENEFITTMLAWKPKTPDKLTMTDRDWIRECIVEAINSKYNHGLWNIAQQSKVNIVK